VKKLLMGAIALVLASGPAIGAELDGFTREQSGPRKGQYRTFGWQERERMTAGSSDHSLLQSGGGDGGGDAGAGAGDAGAGAAGGDSGGNGDSGCSK